MSSALFDLVVRLVGALCLGGTLLGLVGLLTRGRQGIARHVAGLGFCALLAGCAAAAWWAGLSPTAWAPLLALAAVYLALHAGHAPPVQRLAAAVLLPARGPGLWWCVPLIASPLLAVWLCLRAVALAESDVPALRPNDCLGRSGWEEAPVASATDSGRHIPVYRLPGDVVADPERFLTDRNIVTELAGKLIRVAPPDAACNCHGWVWAEGRFWVDGGDVDTILHDNGYEDVTEPHVGDVIAYHDAKWHVIHSGVVRVAEPSLVLVESKLGPLGRYLHRPEELTYGDRFTYHRSPHRKGHALAGLDLPASGRPTGSRRTPR
jgi:hypothetical protein